MIQQRILHVENKTRNATLVKNGRVADNYWTRLKGLLGVRQLAPGEGLLVAPGRQVHTHFMAFPIDVLYVNGDDMVIDIDAGLRPWQIGRLCPKAKYVIEVPSGVVADTGTDVGDKLNVVIASARPGGWRAER